MPMSTTTRLNHNGELKAHKQQVTALEICERDGVEMLFSASRDEKVLCWSLRTGEAAGQIINEFVKHGHVINDVCVTKSGRHFVTACSDSFGRLISVDDKKVKLLRGKNKDILCCAINHCENKIVMGSIDNAVSLWNTEGVLINEFKESLSKLSWINCIEFLPQEENDVVSGSTDGILRVWDVEKGLKTSFFCGLPLPADKSTMPSNAFDGSFSIRALTLSACGNMCGYGGNDNKVYILNLELNELITTFDTPSPITALSFCPTHIFVACGTTEAVYLWDVANTSLISCIDLRKDKHNRRCTALCWSNYNLYVGLDDGSILVLDLVI